jgi:hypothetical protein
MLHPLQQAGAVRCEADNSAAALDRSQRSDVCPMAACVAESLSRLRQSGKLFLLGVQQDGRLAVFRPVNREQIPVRANLLDHPIETCRRRCPGSLGFWPPRPCSRKCLRCRSITASTAPFGQAEHAFAVWLVGRVALTLLFQSARQRGLLLQRGG